MNRWTLPLLLLLAPLLGACGSKEASETALPEYQPKEGWTPECIGRHLVDVPEPIDLGAARLTHMGMSWNENEHGSGVEKRSDPLGGGITVAGLNLLETVPLQDAQSFDEIWYRADRTYRIDFLRDGGPSSERAEREKQTQKHQLPDHAYIWRHKDTVDFSTLVKADMRARILFGKLSGEGSLQQARAVVDQLWPRFSTRKPGEWPKDKAGICTPYGFIADPEGLTERDQSISLAFVSPQHPGLKLRVTITTNNPKTMGVMHSPLPIDQRPTPWEEEAKWAKERREKCRPQQGTASRDLFGCAFAGARDIRRWRDVQFVKLADGQVARLLAYENNTGLLGDEAYTVEIETAGEPDSAAAPQISVSASAYVPNPEKPETASRKPPPLDEAIAVVKILAASVRPRPGAIRPDAAVRDSLEGVR